MTALWTTSALTQATRGQATAPITATGISIDTRSLRPGDLFIALRGETDGHAYLAAAAARGACGAVVDHIPNGAPPALKLLRVADTTAALTALGAAGRARFGGRVIAVTGSVGKTTTKEMLRLCLSPFGATHAAEASHNNHWGVPLTLARLPQDASACIVEIGMNHPGEIAPLAQLARPHVAVITAIASAHIGQMGSIAAIADEKASIAEGLDTEGVGVLPADTASLDRLRARFGSHRTITFGAAATADARLRHLAAGPGQSDIDAVIGRQRVAFRLAAPGAHMAFNALAALAAAAAGGFDIAAAAAALAAFSPIAGRGAPAHIALPGGHALLLDESYNASAASVRAALEVLALQPATRRIAVLGDMRELGAHSAAEHASLAGPAAIADLVFTCGPEMRHLYAALPPEIRALHAETAEALAPIIAASLRAGDAVLVKGSNGMRMRGIVAAIAALATRDAA